jgi:hypothetical protein
MALVLKLQAGLSQIIMSRRIAARMINYCRRFIDNYPNATGCIYQRLISQMTNNTDLLEGLPCWECRGLIELGDQCISRRTNRSCRYYHTACAKMKNLI